MRFVVLFFGITLFFTGCGSIKDANESNFIHSLSAYYDQKPAVLTFKYANKFPCIIRKSDWGMKEYDALCSLNLITKKAIEVKKKYFKMKGFEFNLTELGKKFYRKGVKQGFLGRYNGFAIGKYVLEEIKHFTEPTTMGPNTVSNVKYSCRIELTGFFKENSEALKKAFLQDEGKAKLYHRDLKTAIDGETVERAASLVLTNKGWIHSDML